MSNRTSFLLDFSNQLPVHHNTMLITASLCYFTAALRTGTGFQILTGRSGPFWLDHGSGRLGPDPDPGLKNLNLNFLG
jgi:hypothetical protein